MTDFLSLANLRELRACEQARQAEARRLPCPHCGTGPLTLAALDAHLRDAGDVEQLPPGACPVLFERRNRGREMR